MVTAEKGLSLRGWIASSAQKGARERSPMGQIELRPQYECLQDNTFTIPTPPNPGQSGVAGPDIKVTATLIATPFYPEAMLVRVEAKTGKTYILATDRAKSVTIVPRGRTAPKGYTAAAEQRRRRAPPSRVFAEPGRPG
jgi:hypothetical protein